VSNPVFLSTDLDGEEVELTGPEGRHAAVVRRVRVGEVVDLVDGRGTRCTGAVTATGRDTVTVQVQQRVVEPVPAPRLTLVQALAKGDRGELAVELATEVGVDLVVPWRAARCVARWEGERGTKALERWRATAREAAKQSRRAWFPEVAEPVGTAAVAALPGTLLVLHEQAEAALADVPLEGNVVLVVGPEGGIGDDELAVLLAGSGTAVRLGPTVLRTSTAGAAAAAVVSARTGRW
jgi:16S rRNA (uracil1498-N3)-methyltransferase